MTKMKFLFFVTVCVAATTAYRRSVCQESTTLKDREKLAVVIISGTVERIYRTGPDKTEDYSGMVDIKKVIKCKEDTIASKSVIVMGFGNKGMCNSDVKERDTRIFLLSVVNTNYFRLNSSLIRINRDNLDMVSAAVQGKRHYN